jgi:hypothetical protein
MKTTARLRALGLVAAFLPLSCLGVDSRAGSSPATLSLASSVELPAADLGRRCPGSHRAQAASTSEVAAARDAERSAWLAHVEQRRRCRGSR